MTEDMVDHGSIIYKLNLNQTKFSIERKGIRIHNLCDPGAELTT